MDTTKWRLDRQLEEYDPAFKAHLAAQGTDLPWYVAQEFEDYLECGCLEHGFLRVRCDYCHAEHLVAFVQEARVTPGLLPSALRARLRLFKIAPGDFVCPGCGIRRMAESAALLVDGVFPTQPLRQWVLRVPYPLRFPFASRPEVMGRGLGITQPQGAQWLLVRQIAICRDEGIERALGHLWGGRSAVGGGSERRDSAPCRRRGPWMRSERGHHGMPARAEKSGRAALGCWLLLMYLARSAG